MAREARQLAESGIYHVMLRGVNRDAIFLEDEDFERFLRALSVTKNTSGCLVLAYCLMTNHVHLVVRTAHEPLATVMKRLGVRYAGWFNRKYGRVGHLFQDRFRSRPVDTDEYLLTLLRYVWANPVEAGLADRAESYRWSSRRHLDERSGLVDNDELEKLVPNGSLRELDTTTPIQSEAKLLGQRQTGPTQTEVGDLLHEICGVCQPAEFHDLPLSVRRRTVNELRTRGVRYAQIAVATGSTLYAVRKLQAGGSRPTRP
ncbi:MAG: transposase [Micropruina sp.]|uniref:transposase n=1 Tax=Micropruina sp. TaxID=2737536 RepID=UPI0039E5E4B5